MFSLQQGLENIKIMWCHIIFGTKLKQNKKKQKHGTEWEIKYLIISVRNKMHNTVSLIHVCLDAHKQHQTERMGWEKTNFSPADITQCCTQDFVCWFVCLVNNVHMCWHRKLCSIVHFLYTTSFCFAMPYTTVCLHSLMFLSYLMYICGFLCVNQRCRFPFFPVLLSIAVMPRDDKPFSGASWRGWWGVTLIP